jgi:hypothetical protein
MVPIMASLPVSDEIAQPRTSFVDSLEGPR